MAAHQIFGASTGFTSVASKTYTFPNAVTGKTIFVIASLFNSSGAPTWTVKDDQGNGVNGQYTQVGTYQLSASGQEALGVFMANNVTAPTTVTIKPSVSSTINATVMEFDANYVLGDVQQANSLVNSATPALPTFVQTLGRQNLVLSALRFGAVALIQVQPGAVWQDQPFSPGYLDTNGVNNFPLCTEYYEGVAPPSACGWNLSVFSTWSIIAFSCYPAYAQAPGTLPATPPPPIPTQSVRTQQGVWELNPVNPPLFHGLTPDAVSLANPSVSGVVLRQVVRDVWPNPGAGGFDWSYLDSAIKTCDQSGKKVKLDILCGDYWPDWFYTYGVAAFTCIPGNTGFLPDNTPQTIPVPWDSGYLSMLQQFINALAARYANDPRVVAVTMGGFSSDTGEAYIPRNNAINTITDSAGGPILNPNNKPLPYSWKTTNDLVNWQARGYTRVKMLTAFKLIAAMWANAFPNCQTSLQQIPQAFPALDDNGNVIPHANFDFTLVDEIIAVVTGGGFPGCVQNDGWSNTFLDSRTVAAANLGTLTGYQELQNFNATLSAAGFQTMVLGAIAADAIFLEFYRFDLNFAAYQTTITLAHTLLTGQAPLQPTVPGIPINKAYFGKNYGNFVSQVNAQSAKENRELWAISCALVAPKTAFLGRLYGNFTSQVDAESALENRELYGISNCVTGTLTNTANLALLAGNFVSQIDAQHAKENRELFVLYCCGICCVASCCFFTVNPDGTLTQTGPLPATLYLHLSGADGGVVVLKTTCNSSPTVPPGCQTAWDSGDCAWTGKFFSNTANSDVWVELLEESETNSLVLTFRYLCDHLTGGSCMVAPCDHAPPGNWNEQSITVTCRFQQPNNSTITCKPLAITFTALSPSSHPNMCSQTTPPFNPPIWPPFTWCIALPGVFWQGTIKDVP